MLVYCTEFCDLSSVREDYSCGNVSFSSLPTVLFYFVVLSRVIPMQVLQNLKEKCTTGIGIHDFKYLNSYLKFLNF